METAAVTAQNAFGLKLIRALAADAPDRNVFVSPSSIFMALGMAELGATGATRTAIRQTLQVPAGLSEQQLHESVAALSRSLRSHDDAVLSIVLSIANALWADEKTPLDATFVARCRKLYEAEAMTLDFHSPGAADTINDWVRRKTSNKIDGIVSQRSVTASQAILTNATYFKGKWKTPFEKSLTHESPFHLVGGQQKQVPFLRHPAIENAYRSGDGYEAAVLPYSSADLSLCLLLPAPGKSPAELLSTLRPAELLDAYQPVELDLRVPRFKLNFDVSVKPALRRMGMAMAFEYGVADFTPLGSPHFFIGDVLHRTLLEVDEEGTVAAAVTAITAPMGVRLPRKLEKKLLVVDRPFALLLCDRLTGAILFAGVVYEPM